MNISEHIGNFKQEMKRRNFAQNTIDNYVSCLNVFFGKSKKDHPKNINERDIKDFLVQFAEVNTQRNYHSAIKKFYDVCLGQSDKFKYIPYARKNEKLPITFNPSYFQTQ
jgi:integrase/recombinase XerD